MDTTEDQLPENGPERGRIVRVNIEEQSACIDYSMSVLLGVHYRSRDGLKPVPAHIIRHA
jgi:hypothetical protein